MFYIRIYNPETNNTWRIRRQSNGLQWALMKRKQKYEGVSDEELAGKRESDIYSNTTVYYASLDYLLEKCIKLEILDENTDAEVDIDLSGDIKSSIDRIADIIENKVNDLALKIAEDPLCISENTNVSEDDSEL